MGIISSIASLFGYDPLKAAEKKAMAATDAGYKEASALYDPYAKSSLAAMQPYQDAIGLGNSDAAITAFQNSPFYRLNHDAMMKAGQEGVANMGNAAGMRNSGRTLMALQDNAGRVNNSMFEQYTSPLARMNNVGLGIVGDKANLRTGQANARAQGERNIGQIGAGNLAGFDSLLSTGLGFATGGLSNMVGSGLSAMSAWGAPTSNSNRLY